MTALVTIRRFDNVLDAHIIRALLESFEITAFVADEHFFRTKYKFASPLVHVRLQVYCVDVDLVKDILLQYDQGAFQKNLEDEFNLEPSRCACCSDGEVQQKTNLFSLALVLVMALYFFGLVFPAKRYLVCKVCKKQISES